MSADGVTVLRAHDGRRLTKRFSVASNGKVVGHAYDSAKWFTAERVPVSGIHDLHRLLLALERDPHACIIRGEAVPDTDMARTPRRKVENGGAFAETPRHALMLDIDGAVPLPPGCSVLEDPEDAARVVLDVLAAHAPELEGVTALVQFSSSAGLDELAAGELAAAEETGARRDWSGVAKPGLRAHVWIWLRDPLGEAELLRWRERVAAAGLNLDAATFRTVQPHYVAAPVFGAPLRDPLKGRRALLIKGVEDAAVLHVPAPADRCKAPLGEGAASKHATRGTAALLEEIGGPHGFHGPVLRAAASHVATNWPRPDLEALKAELRERILAADPAGRTQSEIRDRASDRHLDGVIAWVVQREGAKRAALAEAPPPPATQPSFPDKGVALAAAKKDMAEALAGYAARLREGTALDLLLRVTVGGGKSEQAIVGAAAVLPAVRERKPEGALFYLAPRHDLNEELRHRFAAAHPGLRVRIWRGMEAEDPQRNGEKMCLDPALPRAAAEAGLARTTPCVACPLRAECGYQQQGREAADIWLAAHNLAFGEKPAVLPDAAALVFDEGFYGGALAGMDALHPVELALSELLDDRTGAVTGLDRQRLLYLRRMAFDVLERHSEGSLLRETFLAAGWATEGAKEWMDLEWRVKPEVKLARGIARDDILERLREAGAAGFRKLRPTLARFVRELLEGDAARSINVSVALGGAALRFQWREDFATWAQAAPKLFLDGTTHPDLTRVWTPDVEVMDFEIAAPHQHVRQVPREFGRSFFVGNPENVRRLADLVAVELASMPGEVLVIAQKAVLDLLRKELRRRFVTGELPARLHLAHHGAVTGMNRWERVERAVIVGRPAVNRRQGERLAEVIRGRPVEVVADQEDDHWPTVAGGIRMADGTGAPVRQPSHPDPLVEAVRWSITEGAVLQGIGRPRGVRREADCPVHITVLAALALPLTVAEVCTWEEVQPDRLDVAGAEAAINGRALPLAAADLHSVRPDLWATPKAAERFLAERRGVEREAKTPPVALIEYSYKGHGGGFPLLRARYRRAGARGPLSPALVPFEGGRAALEDVLGVEVTAFEVEAPPPSPVPPRPAASAQTASGGPEKPRGGPHPPEAATAAPAPSEAPGEATVASGAGMAEAVPGNGFGMMPLADAPGAAPAEGPEPAGFAPLMPPSAPARASLAADHLASAILAQRLALAALVQRLRECRPKREHGVRALDFDAWTVAARDAGALPTGEWLAWRATIGPAAAGWPPRPPAPPPTGGVHR